MSNLQYYHGNYKEFTNSQSFTAVCDVPSVQQILGTIGETLNQETPAVSISVGVTLVNPKDNYSRKIGREQALLKCHPTSFKLEHIEFKNDVITTYFRSTSAHSQVLFLKLELKKGRNRVYFVGINLK